MSKGPTRQQRRRNKQSSAVPFYLGLGLVGIIGLMAILIYAFSNKADTTANNAPASFDVQPTTAQTGKTAEGYWYKGDPNAPVKMEVFSDYECPYCMQLEADMIKNKFDENYVNNGKVQVIYREFPLSNIHESAQLTAEIGRCSGDQGKFWEAHDTIFSTQKAWEENSNARDFLIDKVAGQGVNADQLKQCLDAGTYTSAIKASFDEGAKRNIQGTPTVFMNGTEVSFAGTSYTQSLIQAIQAANGNVK